MSAPRSSRPEERAIALRLLQLAGLTETRFISQSERWPVVDIADGGMGSIRFIPEPAKGVQVFGAEVARGSAHDIDGVLLSISVNVDQDGDLFELDIWKVDFSRLRRYPRAEDVVFEPTILP